MEVLGLECRVGGKLAIELQETGVGVRIHRLVVDRGHLPLSQDTIEEELLNEFLAVEHLLDDHMVDGSVLDEVHLLLIVKDQGVIILSHKEMLHLPLALVDGFHQLVVAVNRQWEMDTLHLQLAIGGKIEDEIIKELVSGLRHRSLLYQFLC